MYEIWDLDLLFEVFGHISCQKIVTVFIDGFFLSLPSVYSVSKPSWLFNDMHKKSCTYFAQFPWYKKDCEIWKHNASCSFNPPDIFTERFEDHLSM